jgi:hypothetical protein
MPAFVLHHLGGFDDVPSGKPFPIKKDDGNPTNSLSCDLEYVAMASITAAHTKEGLVVATPK